ncbi:MAG: acyl-CoA thioesterase [Microbacteriaceae bacterium]|nr:acyl-CoA thioesterase [Microbacteriaceae bacterium]
MSESPAAERLPLELIALQRVGDGQFTGSCLEGVSGRVFGGQVLAQAVRAVSHSIGDRRPVHSFHASFVRPANPTVVLDYGTEVIKSGRSLDVVEFRARQSGRVMLFGFASAHEPEPSIGAGLTMPAVVGPDDLPSSDFAPVGSNPVVRSPFDRRYVPTAPGDRTEDVWVRTRRRVASDSAIDHTALLAYAVDFLLTRAAHVALPVIPTIGASLDHAMWFHQPFRIDEWLLVSSSMVAFSDSRSLCTCSVFDRRGVLVATASQEALIREAPRS